jgi:hypothetical protein
MDEITDAWQKRLAELVDEWMICGLRALSREATEGKAKFVQVVVRSGWRGMATEMMMAVSWMLPG